MTGDPEIGALLDVLERCDVDLVGLGEERVKAFLEERGQVLKALASRWERATEEDIRRLRAVRERDRSRIEAVAARLAELRERRSDATQGRAAARGYRANRTRVDAVVDRSA